MSVCLGGQQVVRVASILPNSWSDVIGGQRRWTEQVLLHLDDWSPEPPEIHKARAATFADLCLCLERYVDLHGETLRTMFRRALYLDVHRRFLHKHGNIRDDDPLELYQLCQAHAERSTASWADESLETTLDRRMTEFANVADGPDSDPDVMTQLGTTDIQAIVMLTEQRRLVLDTLLADSQP